MSESLALDLPVRERPGAFARLCSLIRECGEKTVLHTFVRMVRDHRPHCTSGTGLGSNGSDKLLNSLHERLVARVHSFDGSERSAKHATGKTHRSVLDRLHCRSKGIEHRRHRSGAQRKQVLSGSVSLFAHQFLDDFVEGAACSACRRRCLAFVNPQSLSENV